MPLIDVVLINPIGKYTGTGRTTLGMKSADRPRALYDALKHAREKLYWCYHLNGHSKPASEIVARAELRAMRLNLHLPPLDPEPALAAIPEGVPYP